MNDDEEKEGFDEGGDLTNDLSSDEGGDDSLDFGSLNEDGEGDVDEGFMDEVNSLDEFGSDSPSLSKEEIVDAIQAITEISNIILATEGVADGEQPTSEEINFVLDEVQDLAAGFDKPCAECAQGGGDDLASLPPETEPLGEFDEAGFDEEVEDEFPEEIEASLVRVMLAGKPVRSKFTRPFISPEVLGGTPALLCSGIGAVPTLEEEDEPAADAVFETAVLNNGDSKAIKSKFTKVGSFKKWVMQSKAHKLAWRIASAKYRKLIGQSAKTPREKAAVFFLANSLYNKVLKSSGKKLFKTFSGRSVRSIRKVGMVLSNRRAEGKSTRVIFSDYNGYRNYETWNASLYITNDELLSSKAKRLAQSGVRDYDKFIQSMGLVGKKTPDGVEWSSSKIDRGQMGEVLSSLTSSVRGGSGVNKRIVKSASTRDRLGLDEGFFKAKRDQGIVHYLDPMYNPSGVNPSNLYYPDPDGNYSPDELKARQVASDMFEGEGWSYEGDGEDYWDQFNAELSKRLTPEQMRYIRCINEQWDSLEDMDSYDKLGHEEYFRRKGMKSNLRRRRIGSATQADKQGDLRTVQEDTRTNVNLSGQTLSDGEIEGSNTNKVLRVNGGDTSQITDVNNTGDEGDLVADTDAGDANNQSEYGFDSQEMVGVELPIEGENSTQVLELKHIGSGVYILNRSLISAGAGRLAFTRGADLAKVLSRNTRRAPIKANVNRTITLNGNKGLMLRSSAILGVIAVEAPYYKGLKNSEYSVFSRVGTNLINDKGYFIPMIKGTRNIIASAVSIKSARKGNLVKNIFSEVEGAYVGYLKNKIYSLGKANKALKASLDNALKVHQRDKVLASQLLNKERRSARENVASAMQSLNDIKKQTAEAEAQRVIASSANAIRENVLGEKVRTEANTEHLLRMMRW